MAAEQRRFAAEMETRHPSLRQGRAVVRRAVELRPLAGLLPDQTAGSTTCVVMSEVTYLFKPTIGYFLSPSSGITLSEKFYLKPRKSTCVVRTLT